jgi:beta-lactamase superfamily II metal-dependent hydrolase
MLRCTRRGIPLALLLLLATAGALAAQALEIRFLDVGQGDAILLRSEGRTALVDAGPSDGVVAKLRALGVDSLALAVASHNHSDHIGGMDAVLDSFAVANYLDNGRPANTRIQRAVLDRVERGGIRYLRATPRTLALGTARLRIIPSPLAGRVDEQNDQSVVIVVEQGGFRALLSGDSEADEIRALLATDSIPAVQVLKAAHHGSRNGVTPAWLARTRPEVVVISAGAGNSYGHPHARALRYYSAGGRPVYRTDLQGDVVVRVDSAGAYTVSTERGSDVRSFPRAGTPADSSAPAPAAAPADTSSSATARCRDGTLWHGEERRGTCSRRGGVAEWLDKAGQEDG